MPDDYLNPSAPMAIEHRLLAILNDRIERIEQERQTLREALLRPHLTLEDYELLRARAERLRGRSNEARRIRSILAGQV